MTRILVLFDGSPLAEQSLSWAMIQGRALPGELVLFRALAVPLGAREISDRADGKGDAPMDQVEVEADGYLRALARRLRGDGLSVRHGGWHGSAAEAILDYARQVHTDQIVMITDGHAGFKRWRHGSVAERVLQPASVPVLLVRVRERDANRVRPAMSCRRILVPLDGSDLAEQVLPAIIPIARTLAAELILFQVSIVFRVEGAFYGADQIARAYLTRIASRLREQGVETSTATGIGVVAESIIECAEANHVDLIAMCTRCRTGLAR